MCKPFALLLLASQSKFEVSVPKKYNLVQSKKALTYAKNKNQFLIHQIHDELLR